MLLHGGAQEGVRAPNGVVMLYPVLFINLTPTPSRILTQMDSLLPLGALEVSFAAQTIVCNLAARDPALSPASRVVEVERFLCSCHRKSTK